MKYFLLIFHNKILGVKVLSLNAGIWIAVNKKIPCSTFLRHSPYTSAPPLYLRRLIYCNL